MLLKILFKKIQSCQCSLLHHFDSKMYSIMLGKGLMRYTLEIQISRAKQSFSAETEKLKVTKVFHAYKTDNLCI